MNPRRNLRPDGGENEDGPDWETNRERITYLEARNVIEAQKSDIDDIDDKALQTVRITALLLGVGATGVRITGITGLNTSAAVLSVSSFFVSLAFGVAVYNESNEVIGPTADYLGKMRRNDMYSRWEDDLLYQYEGWIDNNQQVVEFNGYLLNVCQIFFILGVAFGTASLLGLSFEVIGLTAILFIVVSVVILLLIQRLVER